MELFGTAFNSFYFLIIVTKNSSLDVADVVDPTLITDIFALHSFILINLKPILAPYRNRSINSKCKEDGWLLWDGIMLISNNLRILLCIWWDWLEINFILLSCKNKSIKYFFEPIKYKCRTGGIEAHIYFSVCFPGHLSIASSCVCNLKILKNFS